MSTREQIIPVADDVVEARNATPPPSEEAQPAEVASDNAWVWQVTTLSVVLGILLALAVSTTGHRRAMGLESRFGVSTVQLSRYKEQNEKLQKEITELRDDLNQLRINSQDDARYSEVVEQQLREHQAILGLAPVKGPGLIITIRDSNLRREPGEDPAAYLANEEDVGGVVNELWAAGAEAMAVAGRDSEPERFIVTTAVLPAEGGIRVNNRLLMAPFKVMAIGNPKELHHALRMPEGIVQQRGLEPLNMITIQETRQLILPGYSGGSRVNNTKTANE